MKCSACGNKAGFLRSICSPCATKQAETYAREHTFVYGDEVVVKVDGRIFGCGKVVGAIYDPGGNYCAATHSYDVKFEGGEVHRYLGAELIHRKQ